MVRGEGDNTVKLLDLPLGERAIGSCDKQLKVGHASRDRATIPVGDESQPIPDFDFRRFLREYAIPHAMPSPQADNDSAARERDDPVLSHTLTKGNDIAFSTIKSTRDDSTARRAAGCPSAAHIFALADL